MNRLKQLYKKLGLNKENGLFQYDEFEEWVHKFPYRVSRILQEVIKPDAFYCIYNDKTNKEGHPRPFNQSFMLFFDNPSQEQEDLIHKRVINFGLAKVVFINRQDTLDLFHGNDFTLSDVKQLRKLKTNGSVDSFEEFSFVNILLGNSLRHLGIKKPQIDKYLLNNITDARRILVAKDGLKLNPKAANRLIGRLLFVSYLIDRDVTFSDQSIIQGQDKIARKTAFRQVILNKTSLYKFFQYLNTKYNGDMFPLLEKDSNGRVIYDEEKTVTREHLEILSHLFNCSQIFKTGNAGKYNGYSVQESLFDLYDFEIIPVELISSIYENFIGNEFENENLQLSKQKEIKAYYTPPYLVDYVLSQTVTPFLENSRKTDSNCKVLDPACGSGIFLVETLRKIVEKEINISSKKKISDAALWKLIKSNIYGIDIDPDAIDISIFSLYITILDYKQPAEIETFKFKPLKNENFFGGRDADFFNTEHPFNKRIKDLDFIVGNPPWGIVDKSVYLEYIEKRRHSEDQRDDQDQPKIEIGDKEICQAFLVRTSDFISSSKIPKCSFIVSSKVLYNTSKSSKAFRSYFLRKFHISQVVELSPVNNKIRGGNHIFDEARQPAAIITYKPAVNNEYTGNNVVQHITVKPNRFFLYYKTIVIEKHDVKRIKQSFFTEAYNGHDWLWKVLVHGNSLDVHFIKRLKESFETIAKKFDELGYETNGGFKLKDGTKKIDASKYLSYDFVEAETEFRPFNLHPSKKLKKELNDNGISDGKVGYLPEGKFFDGCKLLIKKGLVLEPREGEHYFGAVSAFNTGKITFTSTVCSVISSKQTKDEQESFLSTLSGIMNSRLFSYFLLNTSSSAGIERTRVHFKEFFDFPLALNNKIGELSKKVTNKHVEFGDTSILNTRRAIEKLVNESYEISDEEKDLIDYSFNVSLPVLFRDQEANVFKPLAPSVQKDLATIKAYGSTFVSFFNKRFKSIKKYLRVEVLVNSYFIRVNFHLENKLKEEIEVNTTSNDDWNLMLGDLGIYKVCKDLYFQQDVRGFTDSSFYIIKPNEKKLWHRAVAHLDVLEFNDAILKAELKKQKQADNNGRS